MLQEQLKSLKQTLSANLVTLETQNDQLRREIAETKEKLSAIDKLIPPEKESTTAPPVVEDLVDEICPTFTPTRAYWRPILETLVGLGGRARRENVIKHVGEKMKAILTKADYEKLPSSNYIRWENRVAWQASNMRRDGYISNDSRRGVWEITDAGRKLLDDKKV
jgi:hypothetical protein